MPIGFSAGKLIQTAAIIEPKRGEPMPSEDRNWLSRGLWFVLLWIAGVAAIAAVGVVIRLALKP